MYKKALISILCVVSTIAYAQKMGVDVKINIHDGQQRRQIQQTTIIEENVPFVIEDSNFVAYVLVQVVETGVLVETKIFEKKDSDQQELISSPVVLVEFGKVGSVKLGKKVEDEDVSSLLLEIRPFVLEESSI